VKAPDAEGNQLEKLNAENMAKMSQAQYRILLKTLFWAKWIHENGETLDQEEAVALEKLLHLFMKAAWREGLDFVSSTSTDGNLTLAEDLQAEAFEFLANFQDDAFWEELCDRLAERDMENAIDPEELILMDEEQRQNLQDTYRQKYEGEFELYGLTFLKVLNPHWN